jgi:Putative zinc dependent peptidase (DUF5700)
VSVSRLAPDRGTVHSFLVTVALSLGSAPLTAAAPAHFTVEVDTSAAEAVLAAATSSAGEASAAADAALKLPDVRALIEKEHRYNARASAETLKADILAVVAGSPTGVFPLKAIRADPDRYRQALEELRTRKEEIGRHLAGGLRDFSPDGTRIDARLAVVIGSNQVGWVAEQKSSTLYVDATRYLGGVDGLVAVAGHELFHIVQGAWQPDWGPVFAAAPPDAPAAERLRHNVHAAFVNLVIEGMATYVGDPVRWCRSGCDHDKNEYARELARSGQTFALFDTIIYRLARDEAAPLDTLLSIGFSGSWDQTGYYVGYRMAELIARYSGRERLRALVARPAEEFLAEYVAAIKAHPDDPQAIPLAPATVAALMDVRAAASGSAL